MNKNERLLCALAVFVAALMLSAPLCLSSIYEGNETTQNGILGENSSLSDYTNTMKISISDVSVIGENLVYETPETQVPYDCIITIKNEAELNKFSELVNGTDASSSHNFSGYTVYLIDNIILSASNFAPIGKGVYNEDTQEWNLTFSGTFDGNWYEISNLRITGDMQYAGLFGHISSTGTVKNLGITNCLIDLSNPLDYACAGSIAGRNNGTIENCYNTGDVKVDGNHLLSSAGGITGENNVGGIIANCYNTGDITATSNFTYAIAGGITGENCGKTIIDCYNTGDIEAISKSNFAYAGGIVGYNEAYDDYSKATIQNCYNGGNISAVPGEESFAYAGGIAGHNGEMIQNCYNIGDVSANTITFAANAGGIAGSNYARDAVAIIQNCYNLGNVTAVSKESFAYVGGIVGLNREYDYTALVQNCYNLGKITADARHATAGGIAGANFAYYATTITQYCYNTGNVIATGPNEESYVFAGGITGENCTWGGEIAITQYCYNSGNVESSSSIIACVGGITGFNNAAIVEESKCDTTAVVRYCYNIGNISTIDSATTYSGGIVGYNCTTDEFGLEFNIISMIEYCYNIGNVSAPSDSEVYVGGITGRNDGGVMANTFYILEENSGISGAGNVEDNGMKALEKNEMINLSLFSGENNLNENGGWSPDIFNLNNGFPILADVPLFLNNSELKSSIYVLTGAEKEQTDNFLNTAYTGNSTIRVEYQNPAGYNVTKYQWYKYCTLCNTYAPITGETGAECNINNAINATCGCTNDSANNEDAFNTLLVKVTLSNGTNEYVYTSLARIVQHMDECYAVQFDMDVTLVDSSGNVVSPVNGIYVIENGKYTYSAVVDDKTIKNSFTVSSDMFVSVEEGTNILYYAIVIAIVILVLIAAFYFIRKK